MKPLYDGEFSTLKGEKELVAENVALKEIVRTYRISHKLHFDCATEEECCLLCWQADALLKEN